MRNFITCISLFFPLIVLSQNMMGNNGTTINLNIENTTNTNVELKKHDKIYEKSNISDIYKLQLGVSKPFFQDKVFRISGGVLYNYFHQTFTHIKILDDNFVINNKSSHHLIDINTNTFFSTKLLQKPLISFCNIKAEFSNYGFGKITGFCTGVLMMKQTRDMSWGFGLIGLINTTSPFPIFPMFLYRKMIKNKITLEIMPPQFNISCGLSPKSKFGIGINIEGEHFYIKPNNINLPKICLHSRSIMKSGLTFEHEINKQLIFNANTGLKLITASKVYKRNRNNCLFEYSEDPSLYFNISFKYKI